MWNVTSEKKTPDLWFPVIIRMLFMFLKNIPNNVLSRKKKEKHLDHCPILSQLNLSSTYHVSDSSI